MPEPDEKKNKPWKYFTYPVDGTEKTLPAGRTRIDFYKGEVTLPDGTTENLLTSLEQEDDTHVRGAYVGVDKDVVAWLDNGSKTPVPASDYWSLINVSFKTLWIETTLETKITVWASTGPYTMLRRTKSQASKKAQQLALVEQNKRFINVTSPTTQTLRGVWIESLSQGFAVGSSGVILDYNGDVWTEMTSPTATQLNKVASDTLGVSGNTKGAWAVGKTGVLAYYDTVTKTWSLDAQSGVITSEDLNGLLIYDVNAQVHAVGNAGKILLWDGTTWTVQTVGNEALRGIAYDYNGDLWICGNSGKLLKSTDYGASWVSVPSGVTAQLNYIWFTPSRDVGYAVGADGMLLEITPSKNTTSVIPLGLPTGGLGSVLYSIELTSDRSGFVVGNAGNIFYWDGEEFYQVTSPTSYALADVCGTAINVVFAVGVDGNIVKLMAETYGTTIESRGVEITPMKEEHKETQIFTDKAITDTADHNSSIFNSSRYKFITFYIKNTHNQALTAQVKANRANSAIGAVTVGPTFSIPATIGIEARTLLMENDGYLPYLFVTVTASVSPASGNVNAYAIGRN